MSGTVCCYSGCKKSYSTDKDVSFFKFPDDPKRRKKWMQNCGNMEMETLSDRQLRGKRICSDHFTSNSFIRPESKTALNDKAVPIRSKNADNEKAPTTPTIVTTPARGGRKSKEPATPASTPKPVAIKTKATTESPDDPKRRKKMNQNNVEIETLPVPILPDRQLRGKKLSSTPSSESKTALNDKAVPIRSKTVDSEKTPNVVTTPARVERNKEKVSSPKPVLSKTKSTIESAVVKVIASKTPAKLVAVNTSLLSTSHKDVASNLPIKIEAEEKVLSPKPVPSKTKATIESPDDPKRRKKLMQNCGNVEIETLPLPTLPDRQLRGKKISLDNLTPKSFPRPESRTALNDKSEPIRSKTAESEKTPTVATTPARVRKNKEKVGTPKPVSNKPKPTIELQVEKAVPSKPPAKLVAVTTSLLSTPDKDVASNSSILPITITADADGYDDYSYYDREFDFEQEEDTKADREFERFHIALKNFLKLPGRWTMGGVTWDPQGKRKVIIISEPEIPPNGKPCVKRCLQCFEDKSIRVFVDQMDMTDVFGLSCYSEKEDVAGLIARVADASSCCGVPEMVVDDLAYFPDVRKRNTSYFDPHCPGVIPNDAYDNDPICTACKDLQVRLLETREREKKRLIERRIRSEEKNFQHPFGEALYNLFNDLADETDPTKPKKKRTKETFFRKFLHDTRFKVNGDTARTERVYIEKPISVDSVSQSFQDIVSKLGFNMPNAKKRASGGLLPRPTPSTSTSRPSNRVFPVGTSNFVNRKLPVEHVLPFTPGSSFTLDDGQEYELIGEVEPGSEFVEMKPAPTQQQQQYEIIEVDDETLAKLASSKNQVVMLPEATSLVPSSVPVTTRIDANDPNLSQFLKAINTSHGFKVS